MRCPFCNSTDARVVDSRSSKDGDAIRRRRECLSCSRRYTTYERVEEVTQMVVKKDGRTEPFDRWKLKAGIIKASEKRPVTLEQIEAIVEDVERRMFSSTDREVESKVIGEEVMNRLKKIDEVAYVRFASVYRQFKDLNEFMTELKDMLAN